MIGAAIGSTVGALIFGALAAKDARVVPDECAITCPPHIDLGIGKLSHPRFP